jgi:hypothetical protein
MKFYRVILLEEPSLTDEKTVFRCQANDEEHAEEQAMDAYPLCEVLNVIDESEE